VRAWNEDNSKEVCRQWSAVSLDATEATCRIVGDYGAELLGNTSLSRLHVMNESLELFRQLSVQVVEIAVCGGHGAPSPTVQCYADAKSH
jgi:hypothetical protein